MGDPVTINIRHLARGLGIPLGQVQSVLELLDEGNTVPFITRYRKDQTGGLDEEKIRLIQDRLEKMRLLVERKQTILRSIELQGKLTEELEKRIRSANTSKRLEDLYLPFKPKKQTLAQLARSRGLETLADEILGQDPACGDLDSRAADYVNPDRGVPTAADALLGAGHIVAERISENVELRQRLREILQRSGKIVSCSVGGEEKPTQGAAPAAGKPPKQAAPASSKPEPAAAVTAPEPTPVAVATSPEMPPAAAEPSEGEAPAAAVVEPTPETPPLAEVTPPANEAASEPTPLTSEAVQPSAADASPVEVTAEADASGDQTPDAATPSEDTSEKPDQPTDDQPTTDQEGSGMGGGPEKTGPQEDTVAPSEASPSAEPKTPAEPQAEEQLPPAAAEMPAAPREVAEPTAVEPETSGPTATEPAESSSPAATEPSRAAAEAPTDKPPARPKPPAPKPAAAPRPRRKSSRKSNADRKRQKKQKAEQKKQKAFSDYFDYSEDIRKIPPHRVLAINRGERGKVLRVKIDCDQEAMTKAVDELCVPNEHPHADFLRGCARDALTRLVVPSLEREARRELTDRAEAHAVGVFAKNLRNLLLQPPVHDRRVLAVDPGFKSGCKLVALDQFGNVLGQAVIYLIGKPERKAESRRKAKELMKRFKLTVVAIGNGTACREAEDFFSEILAEAPDDAGWAYVIVNEAGASVYSTSSLGREEFPDYDATLRGAISIGRRLQDPLSELVKIDPANIGVGLYQHDVKAKHLRQSLDHVVGSCVNYVGVDVNTASPALLRYVSGLNQLTARRVYETRLQNGPFRNRQQLHEVAGFGDAAFVQAAGFLKIGRGDHPLDATWIHPESYDVTQRVLEHLGYQTDDLINRESREGLAAKAAQVDAKTLAEELGVGVLLLKDILAQLVRPGRDPREDLPQPIFRQGVLKLEDLTPGMELTGTVLNVVDFGVFVDIGMHDSGLVHVSQLADKFVRDPHEVAAVGNIVKVWVREVDKERRRVSLTMIDPAAPRTESRRDNKGKRQGDKRRSDQAGQQGKQGERRGGRSRGDGGRGRGGEGGRGRGASPRYKPKSRPKPVTPITDDMKDGREPMRSFSDLAQFFGPAPTEPEEPKKPKKPKKRKGKPGGQDKPKESAAESADAPARDTVAQPPAEPPAAPPIEPSAAKPEAEPPTGTGDQPPADAPAEPDKPSDDSNSGAKS